MPNPENITIDHVIKWAEGIHNTLKYTEPVPRITEKEAVISRCVLESLGDFPKKQKPPIGAKPETFHKEKRLCELANAIQRYVTSGFFGGQNATTVGCWCDELSRRVKEFE